MNKNGQSGVTLVALVVTTIVLLILASISVASLVGNNSIVDATYSAKEEKEIREEIEYIQISAKSSMSKDKYGDVTIDELQYALNYYVGDDETITKEIANKILVKFTESNRIYIVSTKGEVENIGEDLSQWGVLFATQNSSSTSKSSIDVTLNLSTYVDIDDTNISLQYAIASKLSDEEKNYTEVTNIEKNDKTRTSTITINADTENKYYLYVKATINGNNIEESFGPYVLDEEESNKKDATLTLGEASKELTYPTAESVTYTYDGDGIVTATSEDTSKVTVTVDTANKSIILTPIAVTSSEVIVTISASEGKNYNGTSKTISVTVVEGTLSGSVQITGTNTYGSKLTANITNTNRAALSYQWYSNDDNSTSGGTEISGATSITYTVESGLEGKYIYVVVSASKTGYTSTIWSDITDTTVSGT